MRSSGASLHGRVLTYIKKKTVFRNDLFPRLTLESPNAKRRACMRTANHLPDMRNVRAGNKTTAARRPPLPPPERSPVKLYELTPSTVTARRFCDQHEMSLQTATGRSLPYEIVRMRCAWMPRDTR